MSNNKENLEEPFECPVCYTDGADSGLVSPVCGHKLCLSCYSRVLIQSGATSTCPCCRALYLNQPVESMDLSMDLASMIHVDFINALTDINVIAHDAIVSQPTQIFVDTVQNDIALNNYLLGAILNNFTVAPAQQEMT